MKRYSFDRKVDGATDDSLYKTLTQAIAAASRAYGETRLFRHENGEVTEIDRNGRALSDAQPENWYEPD